MISALVGCAVLVGVGWIFGVEHGIRLGQTRQSNRCLCGGTPVWLGGTLCAKCAQRRGGDPISKLMGFGS